MIWIRTILQWSLSVTVACLFAGIAILSGLIDRSGRLTHYTNRFFFRFFLPILGIRMKVIGGEGMDPRQRYMICANHQGLFDIFALTAALPIQFRWVAKKDYFKIPIIGLGMKMSRYVALDRRDREKDRQVLNAIVGRIRAGDSFAMFPEGTRTRDGSIGPFKFGAFQAACEAVVPILPVTIVGSFERMRKGEWHVRPGLIRLIIAPPIPPNNETVQSLLEKTSRVISQNYHHYQSMN